MLGAAPHRHRFENSFAALFGDTSEVLHCCDNNIPRRFSELVGKFRDLLDQIIREAKNLSLFRWRGHVKGPDLLNVIGPEPPIRLITTEGSLRGETVRKFGPQLYGMLGRLVSISRPRAMSCPIWAFKASTFSKVISDRNRSAR